MKLVLRFIIAILISLLFCDFVLAQCSRIDSRGKQLCQLMHTLFRGDANARANMSQEWRSPSGDYEEGTHAGIDFAVGGQSNIPFYAVAGGTVIYKSNGNGDDGERNSVIVIFVTNTKSGFPELHKYGHGSGLLVSTGQVVSAGQKLGITDKIGFAYGKHVHFEVSIAKYSYNNHSYDLTISDALQYKALGPRGVALKQFMHLSVTSKTVDPIPEVFGLKSQGSGFRVRGIPDYLEVQRGQTASFELQIFGGRNNTPFRFEGLNLPKGFDPSGTGWTVQGVSASDIFPASTTLKIKTNQITSTGTFGITLKTIATDGQEKTYYVVLKVK